MSSFEIIVAGVSTMNAAGTAAVWFRLGQLENLKDRVKRLEEHIWGVS